MPQIERTPVAVIVLERHGRTRTKLKFPLAEQGLYPLTEEAKAEAHAVGRKLAGYVGKQVGLATLRRHGVYVHFAPTGYTRAVQTGERTAEGLKAVLKAKRVKVANALQHHKPEGSLRFIEMPDLHYPSEPEDVKAVLDAEEAWAKGAELPGWEKQSAVVRRTRSAALLRSHVVSEFAKLAPGTKNQLPVYVYVSHGPGAAADKLTEPRSPLGFALNHFFSPAERQQFNIPAEIVRGEAVAAVVYSDGSVHAKHLKPK